MSLYENTKGHIKKEAKDMWWLFGWQCDTFAEKCHLFCIAVSNFIFVL